MSRTSTRAILAVAILAAGLLFRREQTAGAQEAPGRKLAFLVGVNQYRHAKLDPLQFAERDVEELATILKEQEYTVVLLSPAEGKKNPRFIPNRENIEARLKELLKNTGRNDQILVGLAGHGIQPDGSGDSFFCPFDANPSVEAGKGSDPSKALFPETLVAITGKQGLLRTLDNSGIGRKMLLIDACRNDPESGRGRGVGSTITELPEKTWLLLSCSARQRAWETGKLGGGHGVFFHYVLEGLKGQAADARGRVTWQRLSEYVSEQVESEVPKIIGEGATQSPDEKRSGSGVPILALLAKRPETPAPAPTPPLTPSSSSSPSSSTQTEKEPADAEITNKIGMKLRLIPAGEFTMGGILDDEAKHKVQITQPFYMGKYEVTQSEYAKFKSQWSLFDPSSKTTVSDRVKGMKTDNFPAENMTWYDAIEFCNLMSKDEGLPEFYQLTEVERNAAGILKATVTIAGGRGYRLPTEAEWEYACRAGTESDFHFGDRASFRLANINDDYEAKRQQGEKPLLRTTTVGQYPPNKFGLFDMHGNVGEYCQDWYKADYYKDSPLKDPRGPASGTENVVRGGSWETLYFSGAHSSRRYKSFSGTCSNTTGFRVVRAHPAR